jgi:Tfp pilus assembly major pilin PilA
MKQAQRGITLSGLIYSCIIIGFIAVVAMKLFPLYNEKMKVDFAMEKVAGTPGSGERSKSDLVKSVMRQFEVSDVDRWKTTEFAKLLQVRKVKGKKNKVMSLDYEIRGPLFGELDVVLKYSNALDLGVSGQ